MRAKVVLGQEEETGSKMGEEVSQRPYENKTEPDGQHEQEPELDLRGAETQGRKWWQGEYHTRQRALIATT